MQEPKRPNQKGVQRFPCGLPVRGLKVSLAALVAASFSGVMPAVAFADASSILETWAQAAQDSASAGYQAYSTLDTTDDAGQAQSESTALPSKYDLRDPNGDGNTSDSVVTPVKLQNPWGACWGFSTIAACETSILSKAGKTYEETQLDLSELQLIQSVFNGKGALAKYVGNAQSGEGYINGSDNVNLGLDLGGFMSYGANIFAMGIGPATEATAAYRNTGIYDGGTAHEDDPVFSVVVSRFVDPSDADTNASTSKSASQGTSEGTSQTKASTGNGLGVEYDEDFEDRVKDKVLVTNVEYLTKAGIEEIDNDDMVRAYKVTGYAGNYTDASGKTVYTDWTVESQQEDKEDDSWLNTSVCNLEDGNELPSTRNLDENGKFESVNWKAVDNIKNELYKDPDDADDFSRAVSVGFASDVARPDDLDEPAQYISTEWAHYTYEDVQADHAVTIVGWDDDYDASNFAKGFEDSEEGAAAHTPEGNGAWLVKNSWGSETDDSDSARNFPNSWGIENENGEHTGYFWISYYDKSLTLFESFNFDLNSYNDNDEYVIDQYDYLPVDNAVVYEGSDTPVYTANIFTAEEDMDVRTLSCATYKTDTTVTYQLFLLDDEAKSPTDLGHSTLVYTGEKSFDYGGYHRISIDEDEWVPMRKGQRYAVVTTQQAADGKYYQGVAVNLDCAKLTDEELEEYAKKEKEVIEKYYRSEYSKNLEDFYKTEEGKARLNGRTVEEAVAEDLDRLMKSEDTVKKIESELETAVDTRSKAYFVGVVNKGESFAGASLAEASSGGAASDTEWVDWTGVVEEVQSEQSACAVDNASIKAIAELADYASVDELSKLESAAAKGEELLKDVVISSNGIDVPASKQWMTMNDYNSLKLAVTNAKMQLAKAGDSYKTTLLKTTPSSEAVTAATNAVTAKSSSAIKAGKSIVHQGSTYTVSGSALALSKAAAAKKTITVPASIKVGGKVLKVTKIEARAFKGSKAKTVVVKSAKLTKKGVKNSLKGSKVKTVKVKVSSVKKVNKKQIKKYKAIFVKANSGKKVTVK